MPDNRLARETSPYLLQHAHNPVDWYPWGAEALDRARADDKPIFLSIGYAACHWCHVMERESFEDEATARQLNRDFVAIKVDREERPDLDQVYMAAVQAMTGQGGWPLNVFLTPDGKPFYGGTYFPDRARHGLPAFRQVLSGVAEAYATQRADVERSGSSIAAAIAAGSRVGRAPTADDGPASVGLAADHAVLEAAVARLEATFDATTGGWGGAPKFPQSMSIEFLLTRGAGGDSRALAVARRSLDAMADGGICDQLGGGFHRYATDATWLVPHFEKMLYDNAQLARAYVHSWALTGDRRYRDVAGAALDYLVRELRTSDGGFAASQDADTDGIEGATYVWTLAEIRDVLGPDEAGLFAAAYDVTEAGNWEGRSILHRVLSTAQLGAAASGAHGDPATIDGRLAAARSALFAERQRRPQPARDDKVLAGWNGLAIAALADAVQALSASGVRADRDAAARYEQVVTNAATCVVDRLRTVDGRLLRSWKDGRATANGVLEDYGCLIEGLVTLYEATFDEVWFGAARGLADSVLEHFVDPNGGFFDASDDHEALITRPKDVQDNALPSGGSITTTALLRLAALTGDGRYRDAAESALVQVVGLLARQPGAFAQWLVALDFALAPVLEIAIVGDPREPATQRLLGPPRRGYRPHIVIAVSSNPRDSAIELMQARFALNDRPTAFVCQGFACRQPVNEPEALAAQIVEA